MGMTPLHIDPLNFESVTAPLQWAVKSRRPHWWEATWGPRRYVRNPDTSRSPWDGRRGPALRINEALRHLLPAAGCTDYSNVSPVIWDEGSDAWENRLVNGYSVVGCLRV